MVSSFTAISVATAEVPEVPVRVQISPSANCPSLESFVERVAERTTHVRRARNGELGWSVEVTLKAAGHRQLARMTIKATEGEWIERELLAPDCGDALEALSVVLAVLIDTAVEQNQAAAKGQPPPTPDQPAKTIALPRVTTGVYIPWIDDPDYFEKRGISLSPSRVVPSVVATTELDTQLSTRLAVGLGFGFELERWSSNSLRPRMGLSMGWASADFSEQGTRASQQRWSVRAHVCPLDLIRTGAWGLRPCARADAGVVYTRLEDTHDLAIADTRDRRRAMLRATPYLQLVFAPHSDVELRLDVGFDLLIVRHRLVLDSPVGARLTFVPQTPGAYAALGLAIKY
jgi:hypothetical protein